MAERSESTSQSKTADDGGGAALEGALAVGAATAAGSAATGGGEAAGQEAAASSKPETAAGSTQAAPAVKGSVDSAASVDTTQKSTDSDPNPKDEPSNAGPNSVKARNAKLAAARLVVEQGIEIVDTEHKAWHNGYRLKTDFRDDKRLELNRDEHRVHFGYIKACEPVFKLRYTVSGTESRLTRWFGMTKLAPFQQDQRNKLDGTSVGLRSPLPPLRYATAALFVLLLVALAATITFAFLAVAGCPVDAPTTSSHAPTSADGPATSLSTTDAASTDATADPRVCTDFVKVKVWTNCSDGCGADVYPMPPATNGSSCTRVLWQACYGVDACWTSPLGPDKPPAKLNCSKGRSDDASGLGLFYSQYIGEQCEANSSFCYVFKTYNKSDMHFGCYKGGKYQVKTAGDGVGCGLSVPDGGCRLVAAAVADKTNQVGQLCCCTGDGCNFNKTLGQQAIDKSEANATCMAAEMSHGSDVEAVRDLQATTVQNCKLGDICIDFVVRDDSNYNPNHKVGCHFPAGHVLNDTQYNCVKQLGTANRTCFKATQGKNTFGVCCCRGDNCTADNAVDYLIPDGAATTPAGPSCAVHYALVEGVPDGDARGQVESGCVTAATRVPAAALDAACAYLSEGCFTTHDVDGKDVSVCCCRGANCSLADVGAFIANRASTTPSPSTTEAPTPTAAASTTSADSVAAAATTAETATRGCVWALWAAVGGAALLVLLLVAFPPGAYLVFQFQAAKERARWDYLILKLKERPMMDMLEKAMIELVALGSLAPSIPFDIDHERIGSESE